METSETLIEVKNVCQEFHLTKGLLQSLRFEKGKLVKEDKVVPSVDVHHITSFMSTTDHLKRIYLAYNPDNLMSLCKECHQKVHNSKACQN